MRIRFTLDIQRTPRPQREDEYVEPEHAPETTTKGSFVLDRAPQTDFDPARRIGFLRNKETP